RSWQAFRCDCRGPYPRQGRRIGARWYTVAMRADTAPAPDPMPLHGEIGVLAYDEVADRIQCHVCGKWLQKIESRHLALHNLTISLSKELCGLNATTPLET